MFSFIIMYSEELKGITHETTFYLSENAYHCDKISLIDLEQHLL
jgi:hypothetical protein